LHKSKKKTKHIFFILPMGWSMVKIGRPKRVRTHSVGIVISSVLVLHTFDSKKSTDAIREVFGDKDILNRVK
jgi:hypothetical protein